MSERLIINRRAAENDLCDAIQPRQFRQQQRISNFESNGLYFRVILLADPVLPSCGNPLAPGPGAGHGNPARLPDHGQHPALAGSLVIPYAAMSETSSNCWNLSVISDFSLS